MSEWFHARGGQQSGPVTFDQLKAMARAGELDAKDLVWTSSMSDWQPAGQIEGLVDAPAGIGAAAADPSNPYAAPQSAWDEPVPVSGGLPEIVPGSDPIDVGACVKRGFELTKRHFGAILLVGFVYVVVYFGANFIFGMIAGLAVPGMAGESGEQTPGAVIGPAIIQIFSSLVSAYLGLGMTRIGLNFVSGKEVTVGQMFGEAGKLPRMIGASILYYLMVFGGLLLLIVPGIYLAIRFMHYSTAIVDRNMGVLESLKYSSSITTNNRLNLFLLGVLSFFIVIAGLLALVVGLVFAIPVVWLATFAAYRWMQYGRQAVEDQPGTTMPVLSDV
jgi:hypothetical protein